MEENFVILLSRLNYVYWQYRTMRSFATANLLNHRFWTDLGGNPSGLHECVMPTFLGRYNCSLYILHLQCAHDGCGTTSMS